MAKFVSLGLALLLSFLLATIFFAEARPTPNVAGQPICTIIHGVEQGETCTSIIAQRSNLDTPHFLQINPNINCEHIFVGQWVCVDGKVV
ncbi:hypothetical protein QN277_020135 [Acacia crassicarpa]|uniref:LysM domain-containing protein n=1 Tax=Acacia crassicarpa TaxID=499986 RepID=A0AAE1MSE3_9FABA|nr:hypothetical protein QN277_020135 [Acacia crassicarpa]